jgi:hypothetical protein
MNYKKQLFEFLKKKFAGKYKRSSIFGYKLYCRSLITAAEIYNFVRKIKYYKQRKIDMYLERSNFVIF